MPTDRELIAHLLRRTTFGPFPGQVDELVKVGAGATIEMALDAKAEVPPDRLDGKDDYGGRMTRYWIERMLDRRPSVHERMVWYWHGHLVSSLDKASEPAMWRQHVLLRRHALGNFRELMHAIAIDPAMLSYLDGDGSRGGTPNENFAREVMELFLLGPGNYTELDVRAAARAISGWRVEGESLKETFDPESAYQRPVQFLGMRRNWNTSDAIDALCDHPACARFVAARLYRYFVGESPSDARTDELAAVFRKGGLEIKPLVQNILEGRDLANALHSRARTPVEWLIPVLAITGNTKRTEKFDIDLQWFDELGQMPFRPPNVAGWPLDQRWLSAGQMLTRTNLLVRLPLAKPVIDRVDPSVDAVLAHCGLYDVSPTTRAAMQRAIDTQTEFAEGLELLITLALLSPEFSLL
jgi:uncharacterized protein (DUF1800 family)